MTEFEIPVDYATFPAQHKAHWQLCRHLLKIRRESGYKLDVREVFLNRKDWENGAKDPPAINVVWGQEEVQNANDVNHPFQLLEIKAQVFLDCYLNGEDPALERANLRADLVKLLTSNYVYTLPENDDNSSPTVFHVLPAAFTPYGDDQSVPRCKLECELAVWYRLPLGDPYRLG